MNTSMPSAEQFSRLTPPGSLLRVVKPICVGDVDGVSLNSDGLLALRSQVRRSDPDELWMLVGIECAKRDPDAYYIIAFNGKLISTDWELSDVRWREHLHVIV